MSYIQNIRAAVGTACIFNPGVRAIILNDKNEILLQRRTDMAYWGLPSGGVELGETALDALKREVLEETGLTVLQAEPMALYSGSEQCFKYPNGDEIQCFAIAFIIREWSGVPCADGDEGAEVRFWPPENPPDNLMPIHYRVIEDFLSYNGKFILAGTVANNAVEPAEKNIKNEQLSGCARCPFPAPERLCRNEHGKSPGFCPTQNSPRLTAAANVEYQKPEIRGFAYLASLQEAEGYSNRDKGYEYVVPCKSRLLEIIEFSRKMNFKRLGLAFCAGLAQEAKIIEKLLREYGFEVVSVICKTGRVPKETIGIGDEQKIAIGQPESMCNPILQAMVINDASTEFNIMLGLCVGHDSLFLKYAQSPCTVLAAKDRVLGHNPLAAVYNLDSYYRALKPPVADNDN